MVTAVALLLAVPPARAQVLNLTLSSPTVGTFGGVTLDGTAKTTTAAVSTFTVTDTRVSAAGWRVSVSATQFCEQLVLSTCVVVPKTLPLGSLDQSQPTVTGTGTPPTATSPVGIDGAAATLASAAVGTGTGVWSFSTSNLTLRIAPSAYARTYVSTVTWTIASGP